jgi:hypothetical protein
MPEVIHRLILTVIMNSYYLSVQTYDKNYANPMKHKRNVYTAIVGDGNDILGDNVDANEKSYGADTDISEILAYASNMGPNESKQDNFLPRKKWSKLTLG